MEKKCIYSLICIIIKVCLILLVFIYFIYDDFYPIIFYKNKKGEKTNIFTRFAEMYDNLTIFRAKYNKNGSEYRFFKNGDQYYGNFSRGEYIHGFYLKNGGVGDIEKKYPFQLFYFVIDDDDVNINPTEGSLYLLYYGYFLKDSYDKGIYVDIENNIIYKGKFEDNKAQGEGILYISTNCSINGIFKENKLNEIIECNCSTSLCLSKLYFELDIKTIQNKHDVDWGETLTKYGRPFSLDIFVPLLWILYIAFWNIITNYACKLILKYSLSKEIRNIKNIKLQAYIEGSAPLMSIKDSIEYDNKSQKTIYKIKSGNRKGTGFYLKLKIKEINFEKFFFFTNFHVLNKERLNFEYEIINKDNKKNKFKKNNNTHIFESEQLDYFCIEVDENENNDFLTLDESLSNKNYLNSPILISGFQKGELNLTRGEGRITEINNIFFYYNVSTEEGQSGSPISNQDSSIIGIHRGYDPEMNKNIGLSFKIILENIKKEYIQLVIKNQPIFNNTIGYFCKLKSINCSFLIIKYRTYINDILPYKDGFQYKTLNNEIKTIKTNKNIKTRFELASEKLNFALLDILDEDNINYFFNLNADEQINSILKLIDSINSKNEKNKLDNSTYENIIKINNSNNEKDDFYKSIKKNINNFYQEFVGVKEYQKEKKNMIKCYEKVQNKLDDFMYQIIQYYYSYKLNKPKKCWEKNNILKLILNIIYIIIGIILILIYFKKNDFIYLNEKIINIYNNIIEEKKYAKYEIKNNTNYVDNYITLHIKKGIFNKIKLDNDTRKIIKFIYIEKGSQIIGNCSKLFAFFENCEKIETENLDTSKVKSMSYIFYENKNLKTLNLSNFDTSHTENMEFMFGECNNLESIDLTNFNTSNVKNMTGMLYNCFKLKELNISSFDTKKVKSINNIFYGCREIRKLNLSNFNTSNVENMEYMFGQCKNLKYLDLSNFNTSKVERMGYMFFSCKSLKRLNISNFDTSNVRIMIGMFTKCISLMEIDLSNFNTSKVESMSIMFAKCESLISLNLSNFVTSNVEYMSGMFKGCKSLNELNLLNFNTSKVETMDNMFKDCESLISLNLSNFVTSNVEYMSGMFNGCKSLTELNLLNFNTSNVDNMNYMFEQCINLEDIKLKFNTEKVKYMNLMFGSCENLKYLNIQSFDTSNVIEMSRMFENMTSLVSLNLSNFITNNVKDFQRLFYNCKSLKKLDLSNFIISPHAKYEDFFKNVKQNIYIKTNKNNEYILNKLLEAGKKGIFEKINDILIDFNNLFDERKKKKF